MKKILGYLPSIILFIILIVMSGIGSLIQFNFNLNQILWGVFLITFIFRFVLNAAGRFVGADTCYNIEKEKPYVKEPKEKFIKLAKAIDYDTFEEWIDGENLLDKIAKYKKKIIKKINKMKKIIRKFTSRNRLKRKNIYESNINRLNEKQDFFESLITEDFIKENISYLKIRFKKLKARDFQTESEIENAEKEVYSINASLETFKGILKGLPLMFCLSLFGTMIAYNIAMGNVNAISCLYDVAMIIINGTIGYNSIGKKNIQKLIGVYNSRTKILSKYINQAPPDRSRAFKLLEALDKTPPLN